MPTLGILILWSGYLLGITGFAKIRSARGGAPALTLSDIALPSHRATYLAAAMAWSNPSPTVPGGFSPGSTSGTLGAGMPPTNIIPGGLPGVNQAPAKPPPGGLTWKGYPGGF